MPGYELIGAEEAAAVADVFARGGVLFRHGFDAIRQGSFKVRDFEREFSRTMGVPDALAVASGTAALRVALAAAGIQRGDHVLTQTFTFVATVEAIIEAGAIPICVDIDDTLNMDPAMLERCITPRTRAIIVVHMLGTPARLDAIAAIAKRHNLILIEDAAWGCGGAYRGQPLGTIGDMGTFSFDFAKTMTTGEGGMVVARDAAALDRAKAWHDHGHENNPTVPRWEDTRSSSGFNFRMTELQGAVGLAQLQKLSSVVQAQRRHKQALDDAVRDLPGVTLRTEPEGSEGTADAAVFFTLSAAAAAACRRALVAEGLSTKILPEAVTWHFAGAWSHMPELTSFQGDLASAYQDSRRWLDRAVALPVSVRMDAAVPDRVRRALRTALR